MLNQIKGLHHVTSMAADAQRNNDFFTRVLGLRRVKKTVNFDAPDVYHLYFGDRVGTPGSVLTYFPFPRMRPGRKGAGEVAITEFAVPDGALDAWADRLAGHGVTAMARGSLFGVARLEFDGPDGERFALVETRGPVASEPWTGAGIPADVAITGFAGARLRLREIAPEADLLRLMGYTEAGHEGAVTRFVRKGGNGAGIIDLETQPDAPRAEQGAGSVHHIAFAVADRAAQGEARQALVGLGVQVTPSIDRDYFHAIYFRTPGGVLFEVATDVPGFDRDEEEAHLGEALKLPAQHEHLRPQLEAQLAPIGD